MIFTTLNTIIEDILKIIRGSIIASTEPISKRQVEDWVHQYRAVLLKQDMDKGYYLNPDYIQELKNLTISDQASEGDYRTTITIPKTIDLKYKSGLTWIGIDEPGGSRDMQEITLIPKSRFVWVKEKRYSANEFYTYLDNNYLHFSNPPGSAYKITIKGVFENPMEVERLKSENRMADLNFPYPIPNNKVPALKEMILSKELKIEAVAPADTTADGEHNPKPIQ